ncbi:hypothetical protein [Halorubrum tebenquichense]|uniref:Uncharacterized protein n=1 Tax=Halorubrum tebenquichense DSM 14210 TaxID=1227485 RepID=M0DXJ7_9EURY|nr:hypothetical protein [Halorubrum tebenquichense]ELZ40231.1 hypothetical protein C472_02292 [Halorubrum tebenquichense DSM 14210]
MSLPDPLRTAVAVAVYWTAIALGGSVLLAAPTSPLVTIPVLGGGAVVAHAARADRLVELGYAVGTMWVAVLALSLGGGVVDLVAAPDGQIAPLADYPVPAAIGTVGLFGVLLVAYAAFLRRSAERDAAESGGNRSTP